MGAQAAGILPCPPAEAVGKCPTSENPGGEAGVLHVSSSQARVYSQNLQGG
jgi:hypothetical protein